MDIMKKENIAVLPPATKKDKMLEHLISIREEYVAKSASLFFKQPSFNKADWSLSQDVWIGPRPKASSVSGCWAAVRMIWYQIPSIQYPVPNTHTVPST